MKPFYFRFGIIFFFIGIMWSYACHPPRVQAFPDSEIALGKQLFFDPILSVDGKVSCGSCHKPEFAFADTLPLSRGINNTFTARNTPSVMNMSARPYLFWDGRSPTLEDQVLHPISNPAEMGFSVDDIIKKINRNKMYASAFKRIYGSEANQALLGKAIAAFERTLETGNSPFDRYSEGDSSAVSNLALLGKDLFVGKAGCFDCHFGPDFTGDEFLNIGLFNGKNLNDSGRYLATQNHADIGKFKVPGLRNVALTSPYMHNGMFRSLKQVIEFYNNPDLMISNAQFRDNRIKPLGLSEYEKDALVAFLESLTADELKK